MRLRLARLKKNDKYRCEFIPDTIEEGSSIVIKGNYPDYSGAWKVIGFNDDIIETESQNE